MEASAEANTKKVLELEEDIKEKRSMLVEMQVANDSLTKENEEQLKSNKESVVEYDKLFEQIEKVKAKLTKNKQKKDEQKKKLAKYKLARQKMEAEIAQLGSENTRI